MLRTDAGTSETPSPAATKLTRVAVSATSWAATGLKPRAAQASSTASWRILDLCLARHVPGVVGSQDEGALGASATVAFAAAFAATAGQPAEITNFLDLADDIVVPGPEIRAGRAAVPAAPGLGFEVDEERLRRYRVDG